MRAHLKLYNKPSYYQIIYIFLHIYSITILPFLKIKLMGILDLVISYLGLFFYFLKYEVCFHFSLFIYKCGASSANHVIFFNHYFSSFLNSMPK